MYLAEYKATGKKYALKVMEKRLITEMNKVYSTICGNQFDIDDFINGFFLGATYSERKRCPCEKQVESLFSSPALCI